MSGVNNNYNSFNPYTSLFSNNNTNVNTGFSLTDYASIKNGSYGKLVKAVQKKEQTQKAAAKMDSKQSLTTVKSNADALVKSTQALLSDSLWEKKNITQKDEKTGDEKKIQDYDREAIAKAVKSFVEDYNAVLDKASSVESKNVLKNAVRMTTTTNEMSKLLNEVGIKIGKDNKLEVNEEKIKASSIGTLKTLFTGMHSFADKTLQRASALGKATMDSNSTYNNRAKYSDTLSNMLYGSVDTEV